MKTCGKCHEEKENTEFHYHRRHKDNMNSYCIPCTCAASKAWYDNNKDKAKKNSRGPYLKRLYGITLEQYQELFDKQMGCCAVCNKHQEELKFSLAVDHNHKTGEIRGLLCINCNHRLVGRHTDGELLRAIADYVEGGTGWFVPDKTTKKRRTRSGK